MMTFARGSRPGRKLFANVWQSSGANSDSPDVRRSIRANCDKQTGSQIHHLPRFPLRTDQLLRPGTACFEELRQAVSCWADYPHTRVECLPPLQPLVSRRTGSPPRFFSFRTRAMLGSSEFPSSIRLSSHCLAAVCCLAPAMHEARPRGGRIHSAAGSSPFDARDDHSLVPVVEVAAGVVGVGVLDGLKGTRLGVGLRGSFSSRLAVFSTKVAMIAAACFISSAWIRS